MEVMNEVVDCPGEADLACEGIAKFVGWRHQEGEDEKTAHSELRKARRGLAMTIDVEEHVVGKPHEAKNGRASGAHQEWAGFGLGQPSLPEIIRLRWGQGAGPSGFARNQHPDARGRPQEDAQRLATSIEEEGCSPKDDCACPWQGRTQDSAFGCDSREVGVSISTFEREGGRRAEREQEPISFKNVG